MSIALSKRTMVFTAMFVLVLAAALCAGAMQAFAAENTGEPTPIAAAFYNCF